MNVVVVTPSIGQRTGGGNRVTALRWAAMLRSLGHRVRIAVSLAGAPDRPVDLLVALHARHSAASIERAHHQGIPTVVALTGTDLYQDLVRDPATRRSLELAWRLIALQPRALEALPAEHRSKVRVVIQSARPPRAPLFIDDRGALVSAPNDDHFDICVLSNLRAVKDPLRAAAAASQLPPTSRARVLHAGGVIDGGLDREARAEEARNPRYRWLGELSRGDALALLAGARLFVNSSRLEGGANAVGEAIVCGIPVLASHIDGSVGLLGERYPGYFAHGDTAQLCALMTRCEGDPRFLAELRAHISRHGEAFSPEHERQAWHALMCERVAKRPTEL